MVFVMLKEGRTFCTSVLSIILQMGVVWSNKKNRHNPPLPIHCTHELGGSYSQSCSFLDLHEKKITCSKIRKRVTKIDFKLPHQLICEKVSQEFPQAADCVVVLQEDVIYLWGTPRLQMPTWWMMGQACTFSSG